MRTGRGTPMLGLYDLQNDRRLLTTRATSSINNYDYSDSLLNTEMKLQVQSLRKLEKYDKVKPLTARVPKK